MNRVNIFKDFLYCMFVLNDKDSLFRRILENEQDAIMLYSEALSEILNILYVLKILNQKELGTTLNRLHKNLPRLEKE